MGDRPVTEGGSARVRWAQVLSALFVTGLGATFALLLVQSSWWRMEHDTPILHYIAYLVLEHGRVPYRDIFDQNFPGTLAVHLLIARLLGYSDAAIVAANAIVALLLLLLGWAILRPYGLRIALGGSLLFGCTYYGFGPPMMLEREALLLVPLAAAIACLSAHWRRRWLQEVTAGLLLGCATTIKPHVMLALPVLVVFAATRPPGSEGGRSSGRRWAAASLCAVAGFTIPWLATAGWLAAIGALGDFGAMARNYLPLYGSLTGTFQTMALSDRLEQMLHVGRLLHGRAVWLAPALLGTYIALEYTAQNSARRARVRLLLGLLLVMLVYPFMTAQFWLHHMLPFLYFAALLSGFCLRPENDEGQRRAGGAVPLLTLLIACVFTFSLSTASCAQFRLRAPPQPEQGRVDAIAAYLTTHVRPSDTVQGLDMVSGVVQALLQARVGSGTAFIQDFHLYHHVSHPYIQGLRQRFLREFDAAQPRFIVLVPAQERLWPNGADTTREFRELQQRLSRRYRAVFGDRGFVIYELAEHRLELPIERRHDFAADAAQQRARARFHRAQNGT